MIDKSEVYQKQKRLREIVNLEEYFNEFIALVYDIHCYLHSNIVYNQEVNGFGECVWHQLSDRMFYSMPLEKDVTVAWNLWHITRIEDLTMNDLVNSDSEVLNQEWLKRLGTNIKDTGNAMSDQQIINLSMELDKEVLKEYRDAVGIRSKEILEKLTFADMERKVSKEDLNKIVNNGGLTQEKDSIWLANFWGKKTVSGLLVLPLTRHQLGHLNDCFSLKKKAVNKNPNYLP